MKLKRWIYSLLGFLGVFIIGLWTFKTYYVKPQFKFGDKVDSLNGVYVFYNGKVSHVNGRNVTDDGYNLGLKYQCVEFVKRYYFQFLNHKMPDSYGHAKDFFNRKIIDGHINEKRDLIQFSNPSQTKPEMDDILIFDGTHFNQYGHVAIISKVKKGEIEIIQQNPGKFGDSRKIYSLSKVDGKWEIGSERVLGWLRKE